MAEGGGVSCMPYELAYHVVMQSPAGEGPLLLAAFHGQGHAVRFARGEAASGSYVSGTRFAVHLNGSGGQAAYLAIVDHEAHEGFTEHQ